MKKNMGVADRMIRILVAGVVAGLYFTHVISGTLAIVSGVIAIAFIATSLISFCPLYLPLGINTCEKKK